MTCTVCGKNPRKTFASWKRDGGQPCVPCLDAVRGDLTLRSKRQSTNSQSKVVENQVSRYLFDRLRDWKEQHDVSDGSGGKYRGEVKQYAYSTVQAAGGFFGVLNKALEQCKSVCGDRVPFSVLHIKNTKLETSYVMVDGGYIMSLAAFKMAIHGELVVSVDLPCIGDA